MISTARSRLRISAIALGFGAMSAQTLLMREFLSVIDANELIIGSLLAAWLVLTAAGAYVGGFVYRARPAWLIIAMGMIPPVIVFLERRLRASVILPGVVPDPIQALAYPALLLAPFCLVAGIAFRVLAAGLRDEYDTGWTGGYVYGWEAVGSLAGGLFATILVLTGIPGLYGLLLGTIILSVTAAFLAGRESRAITLAGVAVSVVTIVVMIRGNPDVASRRWLYTGQDIVFSRDTPYGNIVQTTRAGQTNIYANAVLLGTSSDVVAAEEAAHYALVQRERPDTVLVVSGGVTGTLQEILKYGVHRIDYVEPDPELAKMTGELIPPSARRIVHVIAEDARRWIWSTNTKYDAVLLNLSDPATAQANRYYTAEWYAKIRERLTRGGVVATGISSSADYQGPEARFIRSSLYATLGSVFTHIAILQGGRDYFLASGQPLGIGIVRLIGQRGIPTSYVNRDYLDDSLIAQRSRTLMRALAPDAPVNRDRVPVLYLGQMKYWLSAFGHPWMLPMLAGGFLLLMLISVIRDPLSLNIAAAGFSGSAGEMLGLMLFQIASGYVYGMLGLIMAVFMAGLAAGTFLSRRVLRSDSYAGLALGQCVMAVLSVILPAAMVLPGTGHPVFLPLLFVVEFGLAGMTGWIFGTGVHLSGDSRLSRLYAADCAGAAVGAFLISMWMLPEFGFPATAGMVAAVNLLAGLIVWVRSGKDRARHFSFH